MNTYSLDLPEETKNTLGLLSRDEITGLGIQGDVPNFIDGCEIYLASGKTILIYADQQDLEYKFEVFPIAAKEIPKSENAAKRDCIINQPIQINLLITEDWIDPEIPVQGAIGNNPVVQGQSYPGTVPVTASASCKYIGGLEIVGNNKKLTVSTLAFPYSLFVSGVSDDKNFDTASYSSLTF